MWRDIFLWNRDNMVTFIEAYERSLSQLKQLIRVGDAAGIEKELERSRQEREKLSTRLAVSA
jgi:prephenate dehydrogenase